VHKHMVLTTLPTPANCVQRQ